MIVIDDFIKDKKLLERIQDDSVWQTRVDVTWHQKNDPVKNVFEEVVDLIWGFFDYKPEKYDGCEYWCHIMDTTITNQHKDYEPGEQKYLDWHYDKDEYEAAFLGLLKRPYAGFAYYAHREVPDGGYLGIMRSNDNIEWLEPKPNRVIIFETFAMHKVDVVKSGVRRSLLSNLWIQKPNEGNFE